jgi:hypothetical protein
MRILIEYALSLLPFEVMINWKNFMIILNYVFQDVTVETPEGHLYQGKKHVYSDVSIYLNFNEIFDWICLDLWCIHCSSW